MLFKRMPEGKENYILIMEDSIKGLRSKQLQQLEDLLYEIEDAGFTVGISQEEIDKLLESLRIDEKALLYSNDSIVNMIVKDIIQFAAENDIYRRFLTKVNVESQFGNRSMASTSGLENGKFKISAGEEYFTVIQTVSDIAGMLPLLEEFPDSQLKCCDFYIQFPIALTRFLDNPVMKLTDNKNYVYSNQLSKDIDENIYPNFCDYFVYYGREICEVAMASLIGHEIGHNYLGHLSGKAQGHLNLECLHELDNENDSWIMEYNADAFGIDFAIRYIVSTLRKGNNFEFPLKDNVFYAIDYRLLGLPILLLSSENYNRRGAKGDDSHPPLAKREELLWKILKERGLNDNCISKIKWWTQCVRKTMEDSRYLIKKANEEMATGEVMKYFWVTVKCYDDMTFDTKGPISDDTPYIEMVCAAQKNKHEVNCDTAPYDTCTETEICNDMESYGFKRDRNLFHRISLMGMPGTAKG